MASPPQPSESKAMASGNPYRELVAAYADLVTQRPQASPAVPSGAPARRAPAAGAPAVLVFSPHPDDECIVGALPLRLLREHAQAIVNVVVTLGSREDRRAARWAEVGDACRHLGFEALAPGGRGLERIVPAAREGETAHWSAAVAEIARIIEARRPVLVFLPHVGDWNGTHVGTHYLVLDALARMPREFACLVVETEFWGAMDTPNLMVESSVEDVSDLVLALSLHRGEVARNPYHLRLPAWMIDNVRRGAELVRGQGESAPDFAFATLYRLSRWRAGALERAIDGGRCIGRDDDLSGLLAV